MTASSRDSSVPGSAPVLSYEGLAALSPEERAVLLPLVPASVRRMLELFLGGALEAPGAFAPPSSALQPPPQTAGPATRAADARDEQALPAPPAAAPAPDAPLLSGTVARLLAQDPGEQRELEHIRLALNGRQTSVTVSKSLLAVLARHFGGEVRRARRYVRQLAREAGEHPHNRSGWVHDQAVGYLVAEARREADRERQRAVAALATARPPPRRPVRPHARAAAAGAEPVQPALF